MTDNVIQEIYKELLEAEGLVLLIKNRRGELPKEVFDNLADKLSSLTAKAEDLAMSQVNAVETDDAAIEEHQIAESVEFEETEDADMASSENTEDSASEDADLSSRDNASEYEKPQERSDLRHCFTINDRFRFKRELFGNSDSEMTDTINIVSAMNSFNEAEDYLYDDLGWDPSVDEVKDFMAIIERYFTGKYI